MDKNRGLYWILFITILFIISYVYRFFIYEFIYKRITPTWVAITDFMAVLIYFIAIIPLTAFLSEKLATYAQSKELKNSKSFKLFIIVMMAIPITLFFAKIMNEYKEKNLDDVINYQSTAFNDFEFKFIGDHYDEWKTNEQETVEELIEFLSQYRVKKMKDDEWDSDVSQEKGFYMTIFLDGKPNMISIYEDRVLLYRSGGYKVVNGPIDIDWVEKYHEKYQ